MIIRDAKKLGERLMEDPGEIVIEGDLREKTIKLKAKGKVAWAIAIGAIGIAVIAIITSGATAGFSSVIAMPAIAPAIAILGPKVTYNAVMIGVGGKSMKALSKLRHYEISSKTQDKLVLVKK